MCYNNKQYNNVNGGDFLYIEKIKNNGIEYLRVTKSSYDSEQKKQRRTVVKNLGPLSRFDDGQPDFLKRLRESFRNGMPLIDELLPFTDGITNGENPDIITLKFVQGAEECVGNPKLFAPLLLNHIFKMLGLTQFLTLHKSRSKIEYDLVGLIKLMCFGRLLDPASKLSTFHQKVNYYEDLCKNDEPHSIYRALDVLYEKRPNILKKMNDEISKTIGRNTDLVFYDVTNFYFETEYPDEDYIENNQEVKGLRQRGVSKEKRKSPIVQMGLFMDSNGIPISFEAFPGNALDQTTLRPAMKKTVNQFGLSRFVLVSDRGIISGPNIAHLAEGGHGYIMSKSIKKSAKSEREWILDPEGYVEQSSTFKYKSRIIERSIKDEHGKIQKLKQKVVVYWSQKFYQKEIKEHRSFLEFVKAFKENPNNFRVSKAQQGYLKKFMKKEFMNQLTGEIIEGKDLLGLIDEEKLSKNTEYYGYYQIVSSELEMSEEEIIENYHGLNQIENQFKIMKSTLETRPMHVSTREHIEAHLTVCLISLIMMRLIQYMIKKHPKIEKSDKLTWHEGLSAQRIQSALNKFQVEELTAGFYRFNHIEDKDLKILLESFGLKLEKQLHSAGDLKKLVKEIKEIN